MTRRKEKGSKTETKRKRGFEDRRSEAKTERGVKYCERKKIKGIVGNIKLKFKIHILFN
jgi:hypothetical protein